MKLIRKLIAVFACIGVVGVLFSGCRDMHDDIPETASSGNVKQNADMEGESSFPQQNSSSSVSENPEGYTDITTQLFNALEGKTGGYDDYWLFYADSTALIFLSTERNMQPDAGYPAIESYTYTLKSIDPNAVTLISEKTIAETSGFLKMQGDKILLLEDGRVIVLDSQLRLIQELPVPESVQRGIENATVIPYNEVGDGFDPRDYSPKYDISSDFSHFIYTNDDGLFRYSVLNDTTEELFAFPPAVDSVVGPYYEDHFYAPSFSEDEKSIHGISVSQPKSGAHWSFDTTFDLESGELTMSAPYHFTEQYKLDSYLEKHLPYAPLVYVTSIHDGMAIYCNNPSALPDRFYLGSDVDAESLKEKLTQEFYAQKQAG